MANECLPIEQGDPRFLMTCAQAASVGDAIIRFAGHVPTHWQPNTDSWRPTTTLVSIPEKGSWHRTSYFEDRPVGDGDCAARITISAWQNMEPPYSRRPHTFRDSGIDVTVQDGGGITTAYLSQHGQAWSTRRKLAGSTWQTRNVGGAQEAISFAEDAFRKYIGFSLGIIATRAPQQSSRGTRFMQLLRPLVSSGILKQ